MTYDEAIKSLVSMQYTRTVFVDDLEAIDVALYAIGKQICASPKVWEAHPKPVRLCPACGSTFIEMNGVLMKHCGNCGQALKEENEGH